MNKNPKKALLIGTAVSAVLIIIIAVLMMFVQGPSPKTVLLPVDSKASTPEEVQQDVQPSEGTTMTISICSNPVFHSGAEEGYLNIINEEINTLPQQVKIYRSEDNFLLYETGLIPVGKVIQDDRLKVNLPKGDYPCVAMFYSYDNGQVIGQAGANITITVKN